MAVQESRLVISIDARNAERTAKALNSELQGITNNGNKAVSQTNALGTSMQALAGYMAGVVTVGAAINKIDAYTNLQNRLKLVTNSQQELNKAMDDTFGIAQRSYQTWDSVVQVYQRFSDNAKTLGINMEQTAKLTETVSKAVAVSGASTQAAEAALTQFGQALASGTLRGEELNSILEQTPALAKAIAQGMGITVGQLRSVAAEGKITGEVLVDALTKSAESVEQLFAKTDITISQSIGLLSNELTKFIGEAGQSSGAANLLAGSIKLLSENLSLLADAAVVGGIGYITKAILTKTVAVQADIAASINQKAADAAAAQSSIAVATAKVNEAKAHLANVQATNAETQAKYGAAAANARYKLASDAVTQSIIAQNAAQGALTSSTSLASRAFTLAGGSIGLITLGVGALAAGYMYLQSRTAEANAKLEEQGQIASKTSEELEKLAGNDKVSAVNDLTAAFDDQNKKLAESKEAVDAVLFAIRASSVENERARKITEDARDGVISYTDAIKLLNSEKISVDLYNKLKQQADQYDENSNKAGNTQRALAALKVEVDLAGNAMQNAANKALNKAAAMDRDASSTRNAASANRDYINSLQAGDIAKAARTIISKGYSPEVAKELATLAVKNGKVTREEANAILYKNKQQVALNETIQQYQKLNDPNAAEKANKARKKAESEADKARKKQENDNNRLIEQQAQLRDSIQDTFDTEFEQIQRREAYALKDLEAAGFKPDEYKKYSEIIKSEYQAQRDEYLKNLSIELNEYTWTEDYKLEYAYKTDKAILENSNRTDGAIKDRQLKYLDERYAYEKAQLELNKETRMFQMQEAFLSETDAMNQRYALEEKRIMQINDVEDRRFALSAIRLQKEIALQDRLNKARGAVAADQAQNAGLGEFVAIEQNRQQQESNSEALFQAELAANFEAREQLWREHEDRVTEINKAANLARLNLQLSYGEQIFGSLSSMFDKNDDRQKAFYRTTLALEKSFAIARSVIAIQSAIALAAANPFPANLGAMATVAAQTASIVGNIKSVADGFYTGGYTGNIGTRQVAGVVHGQEYVLNAEATKRVGRGTLDALNNGGTLGGGGVNVTIQNYGTSKAFEVQQLDENTVRIIARDEVRKTVASDFQNPNSQISKAASQNLNAPRRRG